MSSGRFAVILFLALSLALTACDRADAPPTAASDTSGMTQSGAPNPGFVREVQAIKAREKDPAAIRQAIREVSARYGYPVRPEETAADQPAQGAVPKALGKAASTGSWTQVRSVRVGYPFAHSKLVKVVAGATLETRAYAVDGGIDPMLIGFYKSEGTDNVNAYWVQFVGYNDDQAAGDLNSKFNWTNSTGATQYVRVVSFAYPGTWGTSTLVCRVVKGGSVLSRVTSTMWVSGDVEFFTEVPSDYYPKCGEPLASAITMHPSPDPSSWGSSVLAFNANTMRGAYLKDTDYGLGLFEVLPTGPQSFLLGYFEGDGYQPDPFDPTSTATFQALNNHYHLPLYFGSQLDYYECP